MIMLIKRKPGMTMEEFKAYYESRHVKLAQEMAKGSSPSRLYFRNYLAPVPGAHEGEEPPFDCVTEVCYENEEHFRKHMASLSADTERLAIFKEDEAKFVDSPKVWTFTAERIESTLP
jgi:uncharacterized protein (TIGR02118 family)